MDLTSPATRLPDPEARPELYDDTPMKRALAWCVDMLVVAAGTMALTIVLILPTLGLSILLIPVIWLGLDFAYRSVTLARSSATWGMRLLAVELRDFHDRPLDAGTAIGHTALYLAAWVVMPLQLLSAVLMMATPRRQGMGDHLLGTAAINHRER